jgi:hypothetical protein
VCLLSALLKMLRFILLLHAFCPGWVFSLRHDRSCGYLKMIFGTRPHGHRPRLCSFVTFTPSSSTSTNTKRSVRHLRHRSIDLKEASFDLFEASFARDESSASTSGVAVRCVLRVHMCVCCMCVCVCRSIWKGSSDVRIKMQTPDIRLLLEYRGKIVKRVCSLLLPSFRLCCAMREMSRCTCKLFVQHVSS